MLLTSWAAVCHGLPMIQKCESFAELTDLPAGLTWPDMIAAKGNRLELLKQAQAYEAAKAALTRPKAA